MRAVVVTATSYYPGVYTDDSWAGPDYLGVSSRPYTRQPGVYRAVREVELLPGFESFTGTDEFTIETAPTTTNGQYVLSTDYAGGQGSYESYGYYRYGFNVKENDNEVKGAGNQVAFEARIYDPRVGRFLSIDPKWRDSPYESPHVFAGNNLIENIDEMGENPRPAARGRRGRGRGGLLTGEGHAVGSEELARFRNVNVRNQLERDREALRREREFRAKNPELSRVLSNWKTGIRQYSRDAFETMGSVFTGGTVQDRKKVGDAWGSFVGAEMLKNPNYIGVAKQIAIHIVRTVNGQ